MEQQKKPSEFDEANLLDIKKATVSLLDTAGFFSYNIIKYIVSKWLYLGVGLLLGVIFGYVKYTSYQKMLQTAEFSTNSEVEYSIVIAPKYHSIDYLNQLVETKFSDKLGCTQITEAKLIGLEDLPAMASKDSLYTRVFQSLTNQAGSFNELINNYAISKNFPYQVIKIKAKNTFVIDDFIGDLQAHFNQHPYFVERKRIEQQALELEKETLQEELNQVANTLSAFEKKKEIISRLKEIEIEQLEGKQVLFVLDFVESNPILIAGGFSIEKQLVKNTIKLMLLFFVLGMLIDFIRYYRTKA